MDSPRGDMEIETVVEGDDEGAGVEGGAATGARSAGSAGAAGADGDPGADSGSRLEVSGTQVCASTLASVSGAALASVFGVAGTVAGAAIVSVVATIGSAVYSHGIRRTSDKLQQTPAARLARPLTAAYVFPSDSNVSPSGQGSGDGAFPADPDAPPDRAPPAWRAWLQERRWGVAAAVGVVFGATLLAVTLVEVVGQRPLAGVADGDSSGLTSIGSLLGGDEGNDEAPDPSAPVSTSVPPPSDEVDGEGSGSGTEDDDGTTDTTEAPDDSSTTTLEDDTTTSVPSDSSSESESESESESAASRSSAVP